MADRELNIWIRAKDKATGVFGKFTDFLKSRFVITLGDVTRLLRGLGEAFAGVVNAAKEEEQSINKRNEALKQAGQYSEAVAAALDKNAASLQKVTTAGDDSIRGIQSLLIQFGKLGVDQVPKATEAVLGLAAAQGMDLNSAALIVAKSLGSSTNALVRYGIEIDNSLTGSERFNALMEKMAPLFGSATAEADTFQGRLKQLSNAWGDQLETIGFAIIKHEELNKTLKELLDIISDPEFAKAAAAMVSDTVSASIKAAGLIADTFKGLRVEWNLLTLDFEEAGRMMGDLVDKWQALADARVLAQTKETAAIIAHERLVQQYGEERAAQLEAEAERRRKHEQEAAEFREKARAAEELARQQEEQDLVLKEAALAAAVASTAAEEARRAALVKQAEAATTLTEKIRLLIQAEQAEKEIAEESADALTRAAETLGVRILAIETLAEEKRIANLEKQFELLKKLNEETGGLIVTDLELLDAQINLDLARQGYTIPTLDAVTQKTNEAAQATRDFAEAGRADVDSLSDSYGRLADSIDGATSSVSRYGEAQGGIGGGGSGWDNRASVFQPGTRQVLVTLADGRRVWVTIPASNTYSSTAGRNQSRWFSGVSTVR